MQRMLIFFLTTLLLSKSALTAPLKIIEIKSSATDQQTLALTVYHDDLALVRDSRTVHLPPGISQLAFIDVSAQLHPETAQLYGGPMVLEQSFDYDLLSPRKLLEKYVGRQVGLVHTHPETGEERLEQGTLLSVTEDGVVFRFKDRIETGAHSPWRFVFDEVPDDLREQPTLTMLLDSPTATTSTVELAYLTGGLSWKADYGATLDTAGERMALTGWVTLNNTSGATYRDAHLQLLAGDISRVEAPPLERAKRETMTAMAAPAMQQEEFFEYHLYTLERPTTIADRQTKQVLLLQAEQLPVTRDYRIDASGPYYGPLQDKQELRTQVMLRFSNEKPQLGEPLPAGVMRFYQRDRTGAIQFIGEQRIEHTPEGRELELAVGSAFDITATRRQTAFRKGPGNERESAWEVEVFNAKAEPVSVTVLASFPGEWKIIEQSLPHERKDAATAQWTVAVPAKGQTTLNYTVWLR